MKSDSWQPVLRQSALRTLCGALAVLSLHGCATNPDAHPRDPFEPFNRGVFAFNDDVDRVIFKPAATAYRDLTPAFVRAGVGNFFNNLEDAWSFVNNLLQLKGVAAADSFMRVSVNTVMGIGGVLDIASEARIERHQEDFGQTLGWWGMPPGPYLVLPFFGPSTLRDAVAMPVDIKGSVVSNVNERSTRSALRVLDLLDVRTGLLSVSTALDEVALDKYSFARDAFLQRRRNAVFDGEPPDEAVDGRPAKP